MSGDVSMVQRIFIVTLSCLVFGALKRSNIFEILSDCYCDTAVALGKRCVSEY